MSPLPYRYSDKSVNRYIGILSVIQDNPMPTRLEFDPAPLGVNSETAACRIRDAVHSLCTGLTTHPLIDRTLLAKRFRLYQVSHDGTKVFIIPKTEKRKDNPAQLSISQEGASDVLARVEGKETRILLAFALLLGRRFLNGRVEIVGNFDSNVIDNFLYDVEIIKVDDNLHIMF